MPQTVPFPSLGQLPVYSEKEVPSSGWYWFVPAVETNSRFKRFVFVLPDDLDGALLCKQCKGRYVGPIAIPDV